MDKNSDYVEIFSERGRQYDLAMAAFPDARTEEFQAVLRHADLGAGVKLLDVPAGGGYLRRHLPAGCIWLGHEPCVTFSSDATAERSESLLPLPFESGAIDVSVSLAAAHHIQDKSALFAELRRVARDGGQFILADVHAASPVARFLDQFVGRHNSTGHQGFYLDAATLDQLRDSGWSIESSELQRFHWRAADRQRLGEFCRLLFDLRGVSAAQVADAAASFMPIQELSGGDVGLRWELFVVCCRKIVNPR